MAAPRWLSRENPCLLIWDNFEPLAGYPEGSVPPATDEERARLSHFLKALKGGKSRVLITTRKPDENWLGLAYSLVEISGLTIRDAAQLAKAILKTVGRQPDDFRGDPAYARLLRLLRGHPRSLEVVLPQLRTRTPTELIEALQYRLNLGETLEDASLSDAYSRLSPRTHRHLPFIGLFASYVHVGTLISFVSAGDQQQKAYESVMSEALDATGWEAVLDEAGRAALLRPLGSRLYELHPTLPACLRRQLASAAGEDGLRRLDAEFMKFYAAWATHYFEGVRKNDPNALAAVTIEEANLLRALYLAEMSDQWETAQAIVQTLNEFYEARGRTDEWRALRSRLIARVGREMSADADRDGANLWMFLLGHEASDNLERNDLVNAEGAYRRILDYLASLGEPATEPMIAVAYHQLGMIAEERQQFDQAEQWYRKALEIKSAWGWSATPLETTTSWASSPRSAANSIRPSSGTARPWRSESAWGWSATRRTSTTSWAESPRSASSSIRPSSGTAGPWRSESAWG